jgi:hypothetical protein
MDLGQDKLALKSAIADFVFSYEFITSIEKRDFSLPSLLEMRLIPFVILRVIRGILK